MRKTDTLAAIAAQTRARSAVKTKAAPKKTQIAEPTPEQRQRAVYAEQDVVDVTGKGRVTIGKAFRKQPRFESIEGLGVEQLKALRVYRAAFDASEVSEVKSGLDIRPHGAGGSHGAIAALEVKAFGSNAVKRIEARLGALVHTMRDVALMDLTFSEAAMKRYGSREVDWIDIGKGKRKPRTVVKLAPKSRHHRRIISEEFFQGLTLLIAAVEPYRRAV